MRLFPSILLLSALLTAAARAQSAHWDPPSGTLPVGQVTSLQLVFQDCEPKEPPVPPKVDGLTLEFTGQASNISWINGDYSRSVTYTYAALLAGRQGAEIPAFTVVTNKGALAINAARFEPTGATVGSSGQPLESAANSRLEAAEPTVWAGEVFGLGYRIDVARSYYPDFGHGDFAWNAAPLIAEDWSQPEPYTLAAGDDARTGFVYRTRAVARAPGTYRLNPINQPVNLSVGVTGFGFFQQRQYQQFSVASNTPTIDVRPLPPAPAGFNGAVGDFKMVSKIVPMATTVGEPITWTIELSGTGNWPDMPGLPAREVSRSFQVVQPKAKRTPAEGKLFNSTLSEDVVLVPTAPGTYPIESFQFTYFDPGTGTYKTLTTQRTTVTVAAPPEAPKAPLAIGVPDTGGPAPVPEAPGGIPRDPAAGPDSVALPWPGRILASLAAAPFAFAGIWWLFLALRRARETDPGRGRRAAHQRLAALLARPSAPSAEFILSWQRDAAALWEIGHAAPGPEAFGDPAWASLWREADRVLYGPNSDLPPDWVRRAEAALAAKRAPAFARARLFLPSNLIPWLFALALLPAWIAPVRGAEPSSAYHRGDFAEAEKGWRAAEARDPADWTTRYNLSLALAQQNRWNEAAAQASAAFVQQPGNASTRWQFALASDKAGFSPDALAGFLSPGPLQELARLASPAEWQRIGVGAAVLAAFALGLLLAGGYGLVRRSRSAPVGLALVLAAVALGTAAAAGWHAFGTARDTQAVVVWRSSTLRSIPTEADTSQKTTPLGAGSIAIADKAFLGWVRLSFENGQTGWVRKDEVVGIWR